MPVGSVATVVSEVPKAPVRMAQILVVDDDEHLIELLRLVLGGEGYVVTIALDAATAIQKAHDESIDLVVLDVALGQDDGRVVLSEIHKIRDLPVILISGRGDAAERILGLRLGADDYLGKPFSPMELAARVESVLRRASHRANGYDSNGYGSNGYNSKGHVAPAEPTVGLAVVEPTREVFVDGERVDLTAKEFDLLAFLTRSPRQVFSRGQLLQHVWTSRPDWQDEATVTEHIRRVRRKIERDASRPRWLTTVRGVGYRFEP